LTVAAAGVVIVSPPGEFDTVASAVEPVLTAERLVERVTTELRYNPICCCETDAFPQLFVLNDEYDTIRSHLTPVVYCYTFVNTNCFSPTS